MPLHRLFAIALFSAGAFAVSLSAPPPAGAHQYIANGGFEHGTEAWSILSDGSTFDTASDDVPAHVGSGRARLVLGQPNFRVNQSVANVPPGTYRVTMSLRVESTSAVVRLEIVTDPAWAYPFSPASFSATPGEWQHVAADVVIPGASWVSIRLIGSGTVGDRIYIDDVGFDGAAPATMTPTYTHTPLPPTSTPAPPTATKTAKATSSPSQVPTSTPERAGADTLASGTLANGGFEDVADGLPAAWSKYGGSLSVATSPVLTGGRAARLESTTGSTKWLYQTVSITGGASYAFEAWLWHDDQSVASAFLRVSWYASADGSGEAIGTADSRARLDTPVPEWRHLTTAGITAPPDALTAKLRIMLQPHSDARAAIYADDAVFRPADPAASAQAAVSADEPAASEAPPRGADRSAVTAQGLIGGSTPLDSTGIVINEVLYDSLDPTDDATGEWIELYNAGTQSVDLSGWFIADNKAVDELPTHILDPRSYVVIVASDSLHADMNQAGIAAVRIAGNLGNSLNNDGDFIALIHPSGRFVDAVSWGDDTAALDPGVTDVPAGHSIERRSAGSDSNTADDFIDNERPSPGRPYSGMVAAAPLSRPSTSNVQILSGESGSSLAWLTWVVVAAASGVLAAVATWRFAPVLTQRLRHQ